MEMDWKNVQVSWQILPTILEQLFLHNTSGRLFLNLQTTLIVSPPPVCPTCMWVQGRREGGEGGGGGSLEYMLETLVNTNVLNISTSKNISHPI